MTRRRRRAGALAVSLLALAATACGSEEEPRQAAERAAAPPSAAASPFAVDGVPEGLPLVAAGPGDSTFDWVDQEQGYDQPFAVLVRTSAATTGPETVVVAKAGYPSNQGGIDVEFGCGDDPDDLREVGSAGTNWCRLTGRAGAPWIGRLAVDRGDDDAFLLLAAEATRADLEPLARTVEPWTDDAAAPVVQPPRGYRTVGGVDGEVIVALRSFPGEDSAYVPGPTRGLALGWRGPDRSVMVVALPGRSGDLAAFAHVGMLGTYGTPQPVSIAGETAYVLSSPVGGMQVVRTTPWGDLVVAWVHGFDADRDVAQRIAAGVREADADEWADIVASADGGPGLHADPGAQEIARGTEAGEEWLVQTGEFGPTSIDMGVEPCVKLTRQRRVCPGVLSGTGARVFDAGRAAPLPPFLVLVTKEPRAAAMRVRTPDGEQRVDVAPLPQGYAPPPDGAEGVAVVFGITEPPGCADPDAAVRVDLLDADGDVIGCYGEPPG